MANQRTQLEIALRYDVYFIKRLYSSETSLSSSLGFITIK